MSLEDWPHPNRCPSSECRGQFMFLKYYGIICTIRLAQLTNNDRKKIYELYWEGYEKEKQRYIESMEGLGLS